MRKPFFALIGDVVASRNLADRAAVQRALRAELHALNEALGPERRDEETSVHDRGHGEPPAEAARRDRPGTDAPLAAPLELTAGDEVQGLLRRPEGAVDVVVRLADRLHPAEMVWGLGRGPIATDLYPEVAAIDGPCFHRARSALEAAAREGSWVRVDGFPAPHDQVLSALFRLAHGIRSRWTDTQARYVSAVRGRLQKDVAREFGVDDSTVSESLKKAHFRAVEAGEEAARALLAWFGSSGRPADGR